MTYNAITPDGRTYVGLTDPAFCDPQARQYGTSYRYGVQASCSDVAYIDIYYGHPVVSGLTATPGPSSNEVSLAWQVAGAMPVSLASRIEIMRLDQESNTYRSIASGLGIATRSRVITENECGNHTYAVQIVQNDPLGWDSRAPIPVATVQGHSNVGPVSGPPLAPALLSPADGVLVNCAAASFSWDRGCLATSYRLQIATTADFASPVVDRALTARTGSESGLQDGTTYYWRVLSVNAAGTSTPSEVRSLGYSSSPLTATGVDFAPPLSQGHQYSVTATGGCMPYSYAWQGSGGEGSPWETIVGPTSASFTCSLCPVATRCRVTDAGGNEIFVEDFPRMQSQGALGAVANSVAPMSTLPQEQGNREGIRKVALNPIARTVELHFTLSAAGNASMSVIDLNGRRLGDRIGNAFDAGDHVLQWNSSEARPGIYWVVLTTQHGRFTRQVFVAP